MVDDQQIYDSIRKKNIEIKPEELVRQVLLDIMIKKLDYPMELIAVEKKLRQLPHLELSPEKIPDRRLDIICFGKNIHPDFELYPLLMIECKAVKLTPKVIQQVVSYNYYVKSYFVAVANAENIKTGCYDSDIQGYNFFDGLPKYHDLLEKTFPK